MLSVQNFGTYFIMLAPLNPELDLPDGCQFINAA